MAVSSSGTPLRYPNKKIGDKDDYLEIGIVEYKPPGISASSNLVQRRSSQLLPQPSKFIFLPMPQNIVDSNAVDWGDDSLNSLAAYGLGATSSAMGSEDFMKGITSMIANAAGTAAGSLVTGNGQDLIMSKFASEAVKSLGGNVSLESVISRNSGQVLNPNMELLFKGVKLRSHDLRFDFAPRDNNEALIVKNIIRTFKTEMAARSSGAGGNGLFISAPSVFKLAYKTGGSPHPFLHTFKPCALVNMEVNYTGSGVYATYDDATPVHLKMTLSFQELNPIYYEDYGDQEARNGVGY
jgi:hypothetical protein